MLNLKDAQIGMLKVGIAHIILPQVCIKQIFTLRIQDSYIISVICSI